MKEGALPATIPGILTRICSARTNTCPNCGTELEFDFDGCDCGCCRRQESDTDRGRKGIILKRNS